MEEAPVTAATGALGPAIAKLGALLGREYKLRRRTKRDVKFIQSKLKCVHSILWMVWEREDRDAASKEVKMEAWDLADDMEDAVDDFVSSLQSQKNIKRRLVQPKTQERPFQDLRKRANEVWKRCRNQWKMETAQSISCLFSRNKTTVFGPAKPRAYPFVRKDASELVGMEELRDKLMKYLVGKDEITPVEPQLKMSILVGMAGIGKTTLADLVYQAIGNKFHARAFVSVTPSPNMKKVLTSILQQVGGVPLVSTEAATEKQLVDIISKFLKDKRYLVIVDDIWHCGEWEIIRNSLPNNDLGSRVVTTTPINAIAKKCHKDIGASVYLMNHELDFKRWVYGVNGEDESESEGEGEGEGEGDYICYQIVDMKADMVGKSLNYNHPIVRMCGGVPLALDCMFSALAKEEAEQQGESADVLSTFAKQVERNGIENTPGFEPLVESLKLGYDDLPHPMLKTCLLYCSMYPKGHAFKRDDLIKRWMAERFVSKEEAAEGYFEDFVNRGLLLPGKKEYYIMHPMMRNFLRRKSWEYNLFTCISDIAWPCTHRMSRLCIDDLPSSDEAEQLNAMPGVDWSHIRSLVTFLQPKRVPLEKLERLRVLDIQRGKFSSSLENQHVKDMCGLLRLRHLFILEGTQITEIPAEIGKLQHLETLELWGTQIRELPSEIANLQQLKNLDVSYIWNLQRLPMEIGELQNLQNLRIICSIMIIELPKEIGKLKKLRTLDVGYNTGLVCLPREIGEMDNLETLRIRGTRITKLPKEMGKLNKLKTLDMGDIKGITELPKEMRKLNKLKTLDMGGSKGITVLPSEIIAGLQELVNLDLSDTGITELPREVSNLRHLERLLLEGTAVRKVAREILQLEKLKDLKLGGDGGALPLEAARISELEVPECVRQVWNNSELAGEMISFQTKQEGNTFAGNTFASHGDGGIIIGREHIRLPRWIKHHFNNISLLDIRICKLEEEGLKILREMPFLMYLRLRFDVVPRERITISGEGFPCLQKLVIDSRVPRVQFEEGAMPELWDLVFEFQFYGGPPDEKPVGIKHLGELMLIYFGCNEDWYRAESSCIRATIEAVKKEAQEHPNKIKFCVTGRQKEIFPKYKRQQISQEINEASSNDRLLFTERQTNDSLDSNSDREAEEESSNGAIDDEQASLN